MQFVLNDQVGRVETGAIEQRTPATRRCAVEADALLEIVDMAEERAAFADPGQTGEFVDSGNEEGRQPPINRLVDGQDWQGAVARKVAFGIRAADLQIQRRHSVRDALEGLSAKGCAAPRTRLDRCRRSAASLNKAKHAGDRCVVPSNASAAKTVGRSV